MTRGAAMVHRNRLCQGPAFQLPARKDYECQDRLAYRGKEPAYIKSVCCQSILICRSQEMERRNRF